MREDALHRLLAAIDRLPGLSTFAGDAPEGRWYIDLVADGSPRAMASLSRLAWAAAELAAEMGDENAVRVTVWSGEAGEPPYFALEARAGVDPDALAAILERDGPRPRRRRWSSARPGDAGDGRLTAA